MPVFRVFVASLCVAALCCTALVAALVVPAGAASTHPVTGARHTYVVRRGDSLASVARHLDTTVAALLKANRVRHPDHLTVGSRLTVPAGAQRSVPAGGRPSTRLPAALRRHPERLALLGVFDRWARFYGVPAPLLEGLTWWESGWQNHVVSSTGARGIGQLMPATTAFVNGRLVAAPLDPAHPTDNIRLSARLLRHLLDQTAGRPDLAVAAYYQGLASVRRIGPLAETTRYVKGILATAKLFCEASPTSSPPC